MIETVHKAAADRYRAVLERGAAELAERRRLNATLPAPLAPEQIDRMVARYKVNQADKSMRVAKAVPSPIGVRPDDYRRYEREVRRIVLRPLLRQVRAGLGTAVSAAEAIEILDKTPITTTRRNLLLSSQVDAQAKRIQGYHRGRLIRTFQQALGVDIRPVVRDKTIQPLMTRWRRENVALIKTVPERLHGGLRQRMGRAFRDAPFNQARLRQVVAEEGKVSGYNLRRITRDQTNKAVGNLTRARHQEIGIESYKWRTSQDERVRPSHMDLEDQEFKWAEPSSIGHPGQPIQCRCTAEPVLTRPASEVGQPPPEEQREAELASLRGLAGDNKARTAVEYMAVGRRTRQAIRPDLDDAYRANELAVAGPRQRYQQAVATRTRAEQAVNEAQQAHGYGTDQYWAAYNKVYKADFVDGQLRPNKIMQAVLDEARTLEQVELAADQRVRAAFSKAMTRIRPMGTKKPVLTVKGGKGVPVVRGYIKDVQDVYPTAWYDRSRGFGPLGGSHRGRGVYEGRAAGRGTVRVNTEAKRSEALSTTVHELGHRFEHMDHRFYQAQKELFDTRTAGYGPPQRLSQITGVNYGPREVAIKDDFSAAYMGRVYPQQSALQVQHGLAPRHFETFSMGMESVVGDAKGRRDYYDNDVMNLVLGLLTTL